MAFSLHGASLMLYLAGFLRLMAPLLLLPIVFSVFYWGFTTALLWKRKRPQAIAEELVPPVVFLRPIKRGLPGLEQKVDLLLAAAQPGDWVVFGVAAETDRRLCQQAIERAKLENIRTEVLLCDSAEWENGPSCNPKVCKLETLTTFLKEHHGPRHCILSDSEMLADAAALKRFRQEWFAAEKSVPKGALLTAGYRFAGGRTLWEHLDHLPVLLDLWPGLSVTEWAAKRASRKRPHGEPPVGLGFTLGACVAFRQEDIERVGGWAAFRHDLAEDNRLGAALAAHDVATLLSREVFTLDTDSLSMKEWVRHQHRVSFTYRVSNAPGFFGMALTFGLPWAALWLLFHPTSWSAWALFMVTAVVRYATASLAARALNFPVGEAEAGVLKRFGVILGASLAEIFFWGAAWLPFPVWWAGRSHHVTPEGKFSSENTHFPETSLASDAAFNYQSDT